jgi:hypothetical protein
MHIFVFYIPHTVCIYWESFWNVASSNTENEIREKVKEDFRERDVEGVRWMELPHYLVQ